MLLLWLRLYVRRNVFHAMPVLPIVNYGAGPPNHVWQFLQTAQAQKYVPNNFLDLYAEQVFVATVSGLNLRFLPFSNLKRDIICW